MVSFRNAEGLLVRGTIVNLQRKSIVMEVYNPYSIVQISEVLSDLTMRLGTHIAYQGKAVVFSLVNTGLTLIASVTLIDEWRELNDVAVVPGSIRLEAQSFVQDWTKRFQIRHGYQIVVNEMRAYLTDVSRWVEQVDMSASIPKVNGQLRSDIFYELVSPLMEKTRIYFDALNIEASKVDPELVSAHRSFVQSALHPLIMRAPFVFRTYTKPLGYAGDYQMVNQILDDPRQGPNTYFQMVNTIFLQTALAIAHRNRIDILVDFLKRMANSALRTGRTFRILNIGCGPAIEIQRFLQTYPVPEILSFELVDFSEETLTWTREKLTSVVKQTGKQVTINYVQDSVHQLIKRKIDPSCEDERKFDAVYCAGLFDYLSDKVCARLLEYFAARTLHGGALLITNVHPNNPEKSGMEHLLEWYLIYRDEEKIAQLVPSESIARNIWLDTTGVNVFAEIAIL